MRAGRSRPSITRAAPAAAVVALIAGVIGIAVTAGGTTSVVRYETAAGATVSWASAGAGAGAGAATDADDGAGAMLAPAGAPAWPDDGGTRLLVQTDRFATVAPAAPGAGVGRSGPLGPLRAGDDLDAVFVEADGTRRVTAVAAGSLTAIAPRSDAERAAVAAGPAGSVLVLDDAGRPWLLVAGTRPLELHALVASPPAPTTTAPTTTAPTAPSPAAAAGVDVVGAVPAGDEGIVAALAATAGIVEIRPLLPGLLAVTTTGDPDAVRAVPGVADAGPDVVMRFADDPGFATQWALHNTGDPAQVGGGATTAGVDIGAPDAHRVAAGAGQVVAVVDSGVALDHPDLAGRTWRNPGEVCGNGLDDDANGLADDCDGWDFGSNDADPRPEPDARVRHHGTHVAGIVGAATGNGVGIAGVAPDARIMAVKAARGETLPSSAVIAGIRYAVDNGADVVNLSLGATGVPRSQMWGMEMAIDYARAAGVVVVAAAGNSNLSLDSVEVWPANFARWYDNVITVGATTATDERAGYSNVGSPIGLWAPGTMIWSTLADGGYGFMSGTSMATPHVAGAVAVVRSAGITATGDLRRTLVAAAAAAVPGARLDLAGALTGNGSGPPRVSMSVAGLDRVRADRTAEIRVELTAANLGVDAAGIRLSLAALEAGAVYAVSGLELRATLDGESRSVTTTGDGTILVSAPAPLTQLATAGQTVQLSGAVPAGRYGLLAEFVDAAGTTLDRPLLVPFDVAPAPATVAPTTTPPAPTTPTPAPSAPAPTAPAPTARATVPATTTAARPGAPAPTTRPPAPAATPTTARPGGTPTATAPNVTARTTTPTAARPPTAPTTNPATGTGPSTPAAPVTAPTPAPPDTAPPVASGAWAFTSLSPSQGPVTGGTALTVNGWFPTGRTLHVWFGSTIVPAVAPTPGSFVVPVPAAGAPGPVDVSVRFFDGTRNVVLARPGSYTYLASPAPAPVASPGVPAPTSGTPRATSPAAPVAPPTTRAATGPTAPPTAPPTTPPAPPTTPTTTRPTPSSMPATTAAPRPSPTTTRPTPATAPAPPATVRRGDTLLVRPPAATPVAVVEARHLTAPCGAASCRAVRLG